MDNVLASGSDNLPCLPSLGPQQMHHFRHHLKRQQKPLSANPSHVEDTWDDLQKSAIPFARQKQAEAVLRTAVAGHLYLEGTQCLQTRRRLCVGDF